MFCVASYEKNEPHFLSLSDLGKVWGTSPCLVPTAWLLNVSHVGVAYRTACRASVSLFRDTYMAFVTCTGHHPGSQQLVSLDSLCVAVALLHSNSPSSGAPFRDNGPFWAVRGVGIVAFWCHFRLFQWYHRFHDLSPPTRLDFRVLQQVRVSPVVGYRAGLLCLS